MMIAEILALVFIEDSPNGRSEALPFRMARQPMSAKVVASSALHICVAPKATPAGRVKELRFG